jgi:crotonobetainyl-CoA:carnitine CoA-transferase CaiB-like acyl-CoA transferase
MTEAGGTEAGGSAGPGPLAGLLVVDLSTTLPGAQATQFLADSGADVIVVEGPEGSPLRADPGWPGLLRGKRSIVLDLHSDDDRTVLDGLLRRADVLVTTMRPAAAARLGLTAERLAADCPRLVAAMITGWGTRGPWAGYKGYEALIMAKTGVLHSKRQLTPGQDPAYVSVPYASFAAGQTAVHGILAALLERESSGLGQVVEANLVSGVGSLDTYNWFYEMILRRYPEAFKPLADAFDDQGRPQTRLMYALLVAAAKDGTWLQFAQSAPHLTQAFLAELGLADEVREPKWAGFPDLPTPELRLEWWEKMLAKVGERSLAEWEAVFDRNSNVFAEQFRTPDEALAHPQLVHEGRVVTVDDPDLGPVRQPSTMVHAGGRPLTEIRRAPRLGEHAAEIRRLAATAVRHGARQEAGGTGGSGAGPASRACPLAGVTVLELGGMFAAPFGATVLADLGARVIKVEPLEGDAIRGMMAFPEAGGGKVLQGKESIALDIRDHEGLGIVHEIARRCDVVLQCYRAGGPDRDRRGRAQGRQPRPGVPERAGIRHRRAVRCQTRLCAVDRRGVRGLADRRPARRRAPGNPRAAAQRGAQPPGGGHRAGRPVRRHRRPRRGLRPAARAVRQAAGDRMTDLTTSMLGSCTQALIGRNTGYQGRPPLRSVDDEFRGLGPLYRMYRAADGWVFLAAPAGRDWPALATALSKYGLAGYGSLSDERFATEAGRAANAAALTTALEAIFATRAKAEWEAELTAADVGCVAVAQVNAEWRMQDDEFYQAGYAVDAVSPIFDEHRRPAPLNRFSRSATKPDAGCRLGQHTDALLRELGFDDERIAGLRKRDVVR